MAFGFALASGTLSLASLYLCFLAPGQAWWNGHGSAIPRLFARVALSTLWTTVVGLGLAAADSFHLPLIVLINAAVCLLGYLYVGLPRREGHRLLPKAAVGGLLMALLAIVTYWPTYDVAFSGSDSTTYTSAGIHLARSHSIWKHDDVGELLPDRIRRGVFKSIFGYPNKRPYNRMAGGMILTSPDETRVRPSFFPSAIIWSAIFSDLFGVRHAGGYAPVFCGLAIWAVYIVARRRLGVAGATLVAFLAAANAAAFFTAKMPLSEPLAWFFAWSALVAFDAWEDDGFSTDALIAGLMIGALTIIRPEFALFTTTALCLRRLFAVSLGVRPLAPTFALGLVATTTLAVLETRYLGGAYLAPLEETARAVGWHISSWQRAASVGSQLAVGAGLLLAGAVAMATVRRIGLMKAACMAIAIGFVGVYCLESTPRPARSLTWLVSAIGYGAPLLALPGIVVAWKQRAEIRGNSFLLVLFLLVGGLLVYNTHVNPVLPWAIRRFVPIVIPATLLLAAMGAAAAYRRSMILGVACWIAVVSTVLVPSRFLWGQQFFTGTGQQLAEFAQELPADGVYLMDSRLAPLLLSTPLWLLYDIDSIPANLSTKYSLRTLVQAIGGLRPHRTVYYIRPTTAPYDPLDAYHRELITDYTFQLSLPEQTGTRMPKARQDYTTTVSVFRLGWRKPLAGAAATP